MEFCSLSNSVSFSPKLTFLAAFTFSQILGHAFWNEGDMYQCSDIGIANATSKSRIFENEQQHNWLCSLNGTSVEDMPCIDTGSTSSDTIDEREFEAMRQDNEDIRPERNDDGEGMEHNLMCNEIKREDRAAAALDRYWRMCIRCYFLYRFCRREFRNGSWVWRCYRRYRCYRKRCYGTCNCF